MYKLFENFRNKLEEITPRRSAFKIIKVEAVVVISKKHNMTVTDYLSRIRSVEGVTIVKAVETLEQKLHNTTKLTIKIDGEYLPENSTDAIKEQVRSAILGIPGVVRFTYLKNPLPTNE